MTTTGPTAAAKTARAVLVLAVLAGLGYVLFSRHRAETGPRPRIDIYKSARELVLVDAAGQMRKFPVALGSNPAVLKQVEGDGATPEGEFFVCVKNPASQYFLSLGISYPGPGDAERGVAAGLISEAERAAILQAHAERRTPPWKTALGGEIFIHGSGAQTDWTQGCIALENSDMAELYGLIEVGTPVIIYP